MAVITGAADALTIVWRTAEGTLQEAALDGTPRPLAANVIATGHVVDGKVRRMWWCTGDSVFVRDTGGQPKGTALPGPVEEAMMRPVRGRVWWAVRPAGGRWALLDERGRSVAEATADGRAVLTDLEPDGTPDLVVVPAEGAPEVLRPGGITADGGGKARTP